MGSSSSSSGEEYKMDTGVSQTVEPSLEVMDTSEQLDNTQSPDNSLTGTSQDYNNNSTTSSVNVMLSFLIKCYEKANKEEKIMIKVLKSFVYHTVSLNEIKCIL